MARKMLFYLILLSMGAAATEKKVLDDFNDASTMPSKKEEPGDDVEGTAESTDTIMVTRSYEQMLGDIFGHGKDIHGKNIKTKSQVQERKIQQPRNLLLNSSLLEETSEPQATP